MFVANIIKEWSQTDEARAAREKSPAGYANVMAFGMAHMQLSGPPTHSPRPAPSHHTPRHAASWNGPRRPPTGHDAATSRSSSGGRRPPAAR